MLETAGLEGFDWDDGNRDKNWLKHGVSISECEEVFFNTPLLVVDDAKHSQVEPRLFALGQTNKGRLLFVVLTIRVNKIRVISARDMHRNERKIYAQAST